jgi:hypothetical protein
MKSVKVLFGFAALFILSGVGSTASAQHHPGRGYGYGGQAWGDYGWAGIYGTANQQILPYYSLYPPVYYSHPVPRPYGYSPFALPPGHEPVEQLAPHRAKEIVNPHFEPLPEKQEEKQTAGQTAWSKRVIANPYFKPSDSARGERLVRLP